MDPDRDPDRDLDPGLGEDDGAGPQPNAQPAAATTPVLLSEDVVFSALASCHAFSGIVEHQQFSYDRLVSSDLPTILTERPEVVVETPTAVHLVRYKHVHVDRPVAKSDGGFHKWMPEDDAKPTRNTLANSVTVDVEYFMFSNADTSREVVWETIPPSAVDREIQILERKRRGQDWSDLVQRPDPAAAPPKTRRRVTGSGIIAATNKGDAARGGAAAGGGGADRPWTLRERRTYRQIVQFQMPVMVKGRPNGEQVSLAPNARYDPGGYFIIKGSEKVVIPQKHLQVNKCFVFASTKGPWAWTAEVRALSAKLRSTSTLKVNLRCGPRGSGPLKATVQMPYIGNPGSMHIPLLAMCMLLGFKSAEHVATSVATCGVTSGLTDIPPGSLWDTQSVKTTRLWVLALLRDDAHANPPFETMTPEKIMQWIGEVGTTRKNAKDRVMYVKHLIANEFLPQIGLVYNEKTLARKAQYFAFVLWRLAQVARGFQPGDDRDHAGNKQYDLCGMLLALLLRQHFRAFLKRLMGDIRRCAEQGRLVGVPELLSMKRLTDGLTFALSTGNWGLKKAASSQTGVAQPLSRLNLTATVSHLRRLNTPLKREGKQARPRHIHTSLWGLECPAETPEGPPCGLIGQMAQCTLFCHGHPAARLVRQTSAILGEALFPLLLDKDLLTGATALLPSRPSHLAPKAVIDAYVAVAGSMTALDLEGPGWAGVRAAQAAADRRMFREAPGDVVRVLVNGVLLGFVADGRAAARALRLARRQRRLPFDVAVELYEDQNSLVVSGEAGGRRRALFVLDPKRGLGAVTALWARHRAAPPEAFWRALVLEGAVEYVSKLEEENLLVLQSPTGGLQLHAPLEDYTHCEIHPSAILGLAAAMIPYSDHNQAPRTTYFAAMSKQIAGNPGPETPYANALRLMYPQESLVTTWAQVIYGTQTLSASQNVWVAVLADGGQNQEDSLYVNGDSAARGLFACFTVRTHTEDCQGGTAADSQRFEKPGPHVFGRKTGSYDKLDGEGVVPPGTYIQGGDVVVGKIMLANEILCDKRAVVARCQSYQLHPREKPMGVDSVRRCRGRDDKDLVMVQMHSARFLQVGDKLTSAHGQKGVTGCIKPARDMPWTPGGIVADVLINPHAKPSRMTIGQPLEAGTGLLCARHGVIGDATPFRKPQTTAELAASLNEDLVANGFECMGDHVMHKGETGERIRARVFFGPVSYFRVKQMVDDKHHARARGPVHMTTQQPTEGRSKDGGLRIGEMERDCIQSHGAANVCTDRLFYSSDYAEVPICKVCHLLAMPQAPPDRRDLVVGLNEAAGYCLNCKRAGTVYMTPMPYITKLLSMELMAMHVRPEIVIDVDPRADAATGASVGMPGSAAHTAQAAMQSRKRRVVRFEGDTDDEDVFGAGGTGKDDKPAADGLEEGEVMEAPEGFGPGPQDTDEVHEAPEGFGVGLPRDRPPGSHSSRKRTRVA